MTIDDWNEPGEQTLQFLAASTPEFEEYNRILLVVHASESATDVVLPVHAGVTGYTLLWDSADEAPGDGLGTEHPPGEQLTIHGPSMRLFRVDGSPE